MTRGSARLAGVWRIPSVRVQKILNTHTTGVKYLRTYHPECRPCETRYIQLFKTPARSQQRVHHQHVVKLLLAIFPTAPRTESVRLPERQINPDTQRNQTPQ